ncbi:stealth family protein [Amnibacterium kyonggiense]|uniref:Stealth-like protein n=1 Tax=Amnibacterium kyonggiense TaxID=595671 RepID=A0A4R7FIZ5_9MICO|nr:stealth family protein [Amnibacterium kyonggiense]TDS75722.1 Stealth-like protein [Amnibacterium kyonggiense]
MPARSKLRPLQSPASRIRSRPDVVEVGGVLALAGRTEIPAEARIADLLFLADALDAADVQYLLVRDDAHRPILVVDETERLAVTRALVAACADEPFLSVALKRNLQPRDEVVLVADGDVAPARTDRLLSLYRPRVDAAGVLHAVPEDGVRFEFWVRQGAEVRVPAPNALTRRRFVTADLHPEDTERYGRTWSTIRDMFTDLVSDVTFPIDMVFSWVDGTDKEWQRARARRMASYVVGEGDDSEARYRQIDELRYALRSVNTYLPWIRNIYIATDSKAPAWLADHPRVRIVRSEEFFKDPSVLPTHNSQAVESQLHHIEGLSEHFIYSNDDMFIGRPLRQDAFFSPGGISRFLEADTRIGLGDNDPARSGFENSARVNRALLRERFGRVITRHLEHSAAPLRRSVIAEMEEVFEPEFTATAASPFRAKDNISVTNSLYHYYALLTGRSIQNRESTMLYVDTTTHKGLGLLKKLGKRRDVDFFCLNDGSFPEVAPDVRAKKVTAFLQHYFPLPAPWERTDGEAGAPAQAG